MKKSYDAASKTEKEAMRSMLQRRNDDLQRYSNAVKKLSADKEKELMEPVFKKLNSFLDAWGKRHGYDMLLGTMSGGNILQANPRLNQTSVVLQALNDQYRTEAPDPSSRPARLEATESKSDSDTTKQVAPAH